MTPLIDGDILRYEIASCGEYTEEDREGNKIPLVREWDFVQRLLEGRIEGICRDVDATTPPTIYLTSDSAAIRIINRAYVGGDGEKQRVIPNYREEVAVSKPYKGTRHGDKPFHFNNITAHLMANYNVVIANGLEADDAMCIEQTKRLDEKSTIICSRDKDLRMCDGLHFSWECGTQASVGPTLVDDVGSIEIKKGKVFGFGIKFFYSQMITGDTVDNIPGLPGAGPVRAMNLLKDLDTVEQLEEAVQEAYKAKLGDDYLPYYWEQAALLWMLQEEPEWLERVDLRPDALAHGQNPDLTLLSRATSDKCQGSGSPTTTP